MGRLPCVRDGSILHRLGGRPPIRKRCSFCCLSRLARPDACGIPDTQARTSNGAAPPWWDLWVRMLAVAALTLAITAAAARLGPTLSGIAATYPVAISVVLTFTHAQLGRNAALAMLRGNVLSWISFASCFFAIGLSLDALGTAPAIGLGVLAAVATSVLAIRFSMLSLFMSSTLGLPKTRSKSSYRG